MRTRLQRNYDIAADRLAAFLRAWDAAERKSGFNPSQPRTAAGNGPESGRWVDGVAGGLGIAAGHMVSGLNRAADMVNRGMGRALAPISHQLDEAIAHAPPQVKAFLTENRAAIESTLGGLQAAGGVPQILEGAELIGAGAATFPEGTPLIAIGGAPVAHGYDDWKTGLRALATGQAEPGGFYNLLRESGFDDQAAKIAMATTAGLPVTAVRTLSRTALEDAADAVLECRTLEFLASRGTVVTEDGTALFHEHDIMRRGLIAEACNLKITGSTPTPPGFKTFDAYRDGGSTGISVKTLSAVVSQSGSKGCTNQDDEDD
ncbi:hypothetical protein BH09PSE2_BH09PSE2_03020 [soil metagenome]